MINMNGFRKRAVAATMAGLLLSAVVLHEISKVHTPLIAAEASAGERLYYNGQVIPDQVYYELPHYRQQDPAWGAEIMYPFNGSIELYGCAVTSLAMNAFFFGIDLNPSEMNIELDLYAAPLEWEAWTAARNLQIKRKDSILDAESQLQNRDYVKHETIRELAAGYPVILGIQHSVHHTTHFVVANGYSYENGEYTVNILDPSYNNDYQTIDDIGTDWFYTRILVVTN